MNRLICTDGLTSFSTNTVTLSLTYSKFHLHQTKSELKQYYLSVPDGFYVHGVFAVIYVVEVSIVGVCCVLQKSVSLQNVGVVDLVLLPGCHISDSRRTCMSLVYKPEDLSLLVRRSFERSK